MTDGTYKVKFSGQGLTSNEVDVVVADAKSVLLDFKAFLRSDCTNPNSIGDPYVMPADEVYAAGSETVICSDVSITVNEGATIQGPDATANGAVLGFNAPENQHYTCGRAQIHSGKWGHILHHFRSIRSRRIETEKGAGCHHTLPSHGNIRREYQDPQGMPALPGIEKVVPEGTTKTGSGSTEATSAGGAKRTN